MLIEHVLHWQIGPSCAGGASQHELRATAWSHAKGSADRVGPLSAHLGGFIIFADGASGLSDELTSTGIPFACPLSHPLAVSRKVLLGVLILRTSRHPPE